MDLNFPWLKLNTTNAASSQNYYQRKPNYFVIIHVFLRFLPVNQQQLGPSYFGSTKSRLFIR